MNKRITLLIFLASCGLPRLQAQLLPYQNADLPVAQRVADLLPRMTLEEKVAQMCQFVGLEHIRSAEKKRSANNLGNDANAFYPGLKTTDIEKMVTEGKIGSFLHVLTATEATYLQSLAQKSRLKIPLLIGIDAIHGNGMVSGCTIFPSPISISCAWDTALVRQASAITATEMKVTGSQWAFTPNVDIARDPRWGRTGETFGEDPFLVSCLGVATIQGLQQNGVAACVKHLVAGSQPVNGLNKAPTDISERTLNEVFLPPYKAAVKAGVMTVMPAHNELNGVPCHAHTKLMNDLLRQQWGFKGFYISDWMDVERMANLHKTVDGDKEAFRASVAAGLDMHMHGPGFLEKVLELVKEGKLPESRINEAAAAVLEVKFKTGLFDAKPASVVPVVFTPAHQVAALEAARRSIVLLKNNGILPLPPQPGKRVLVTGPNAANQALLGDWSMEQPAENVTTVYEGIKAAAPAGWQIDFADCGRFIPDMKDSSIQAVASKAAAYDLIIAVVGDNSLRFEGNKRTAGENTDLDDIILPGLQPQLLQQLQATGKPIVAVLVNGRPLAIPWLKAKAAAIVESWEPGSRGGQAVAEILFGKVNPSGKLTVSLLPGVGQVGNYYNHRPSAYALHYIGKKENTGPLFPFGFGLSYTTYTYGSLQLSKTSAQANNPVTATLSVTNSGKKAGEEIVQLYVSAVTGSVTHPVKELKGFQRVALRPGETKTVSFLLNADTFKTYDAEMNYAVYPGTYTIMAGASSSDADLKKKELVITW